MGGERLISKALWTLIGLRPSTDPIQDVAGHFFSRLVRNVNLVPAVADHQLLSRPEFSIELANVRVGRNVPIRNSMQAGFSDRCQMRSVHGQAKDAVAV